jgi:hypothetical protein
MIVSITGCRLVLWGGWFYGRIDAKTKKGDSRLKTNE